jgi:hypothetical protein
MSIVQIIDNIIDYLKDVKSKLIKCVSSKKDEVK